MEPQKTGENKNRKQEIEVLIILIGIITFTAVLAPTAFGKQEFPNMKAQAIISLEGIEPADQIIQQNGTVEIGSTNIVDSTRNTLIEQGLITASGIESGNVVDSTMNTLKEQGLIKTPKEMMEKPATASLPIAIIDKAIQSIHLASDESTFQPSESSQNTLHISENIPIGGSTGGGGGSGEKM